jgi:peptide/nickel transport system substrate-binding protein
MRNVHRSVRWVALGLLLALLLGPAAHLLAVPADSELTVVDATSPPSPLDPFKVYGTQAQSLFRLIYEPLFDRDPDGKIRTPLLERWGMVDPVTWELRLRPGIRFHDGGTLTAADVVYSLRRILDPQVASPRRRDFAELDGVVAVDPLTVRIATKRPYPLLPARLSQFSMVLPDQLRGLPESDFFRQPIGLGPFRLAEIDQAQAVLTAFPEHHGGQPKIPRVVFRFIAEPDDRLRQLLTGSADIVTNLLPQQVDLLLQSRGVRLVKRHSIRFFEVFVDPHRGPLGRLEVRRALLHGIDIEGLVRHVARGNGRPIAAVTLPEDFGYHPDLRPYGFNPARARALLAEAGYSKGFRLQGLATHETRTVATALSQQWARLGVTLDIAVDGRAPTLSRWIRERGQHDFLIADPTSIMFDAAFQLRVHLDPAHPMARATHPRALGLLNQSDAELDPAVRGALLREVQAIVHEQALTVPLYQVTDLYGVSRRVKDFVGSADTILRLADVDLTR